MIRTDEAILILKGRLDKNSELLLSAKMINFSVLSKCRVVAIEGDKVTLWPVKDGAAAFVFSVDSEHLELNYSQLREFKGRPGLETVAEEKLDNSALLISLPLQAIDSSNPLNVSVETIILQEL
jgi:hypothetical protein